VSTSIPAFGKRVVFLRLILRQQVAFNKLHVTVHIRGEVPKVTLTNLDEARHLQIQKLTRLPSCSVSMQPKYSTRFAMEVPTFLAYLLHQQYLPNLLSSICNSFSFSAPEKPAQSSLIYFTIQLKTGCALGRGCGLRSG